MPRLGTGTPMTGMPVRRHGWEQSSSFSPPGPAPVFSDAGMWGTVAGAALVALLLALAGATLA